MCARLCVHAFTTCYMCALVYNYLFYFLIEVVNVTMALETLVVFSLLATTLALGEYLHIPMTDVHQFL
jgi:hypothetical protein